MRNIFAHDLISQRQGPLHTKAHSNILTISCRTSVGNLQLDIMEAGNVLDEA